MGSPLDELSATPDAAAVDVLSVLTAGDVAEAFARFRDRQSATARAAGFGGITTEQRAQIEALQARLDVGEVTPDEFADEVRDVLRDVDPASAFAGLRFLGAPFGVEGANDLAALIGLDEAQRQQALQLYRLLHADIADVRAAAQVQIRTLLTAPQQALLTEVGQEMLAGAGVSDEQQAVARSALDLLTQRLDLTTGQLDQIAAMREFLRGVVEDLHAQARVEILRLLTESQLQLSGLIKRS